MLEILEELYTVIDDDPFSNLRDIDLSLLTQHIDPSPAISNTTLKPQSVFYPSQSKGPFLEAFYRLVYANFSKLCSQSWQSQQYIPCNLTLKENPNLKNSDGRL